MTSSTRDSSSIFSTKAELNLMHWANHATSGWLMKIYFYIQHNELVQRRFLFVANFTANGHEINKKKIAFNTVSTNALLQRNSSFFEYWYAWEWGGMAKWPHSIPAAKKTSKGRKNYKNKFSNEKAEHKRRHKYAKCSCPPVQHCEHFIHLLCKTETDREWERETEN